MLVLGLAPIAAAASGGAGVAVPEWVTGASLLLPFVLGFALRARPVGGWLVVYLWEGVLRAAGALLVGVAANLKLFPPTAWHGDHRRYVAFLVAELPPVLLATIEMIVAMSTLRPSSRSAAGLRRLRTVLGVEIGAGLLAAALDALYWPQNLLLSVPGVAWPVIWSAYFRSSKRVHRVFGTPEAPGPGSIDSGHAAATAEPASG
jgi:hypothetical protein